MRFGPGTASCLGACRAPTMAQKSATHAPRHALTSKSSLVVHRGVALMLCESAAVLEETLRSMDASAMHLQRVGDRALVLPQEHVPEVRQILHAQGIYPRIVAAAVDATDDGGGEEA